MDAMFSAKVEKGHVAKVWWVEMTSIDRGRLGGVAHPNDAWVGGVRRDGSSPEAEGGWVVGQRWRSMGDGRRAGR